VARFLDHRLCNSVIFVMLRNDAHPWLDNMAYAEVAVLVEEASYLVSGRLNCGMRLCEVTCEDAPHCSLPRRPYPIQSSSGRSLANVDVELQHAPQPCRQNTRAAAVVHMN